MEEVTLDEIKNYILENVNLNELCREISLYSGIYSDVMYYENDDDFFVTFYSDDVMEAVRAVCYGEYTFTDDYVRIDAYGNLQSASELEVEEELSGYVDDFIMNLLDDKDMRNSIDIDSTLKQMLDDYKEEDKNEE